MDSNHLDQDKRFPFFLPLIAILVIIWIIVFLYHSQKPQEMAPGPLHHENTEVIVKQEAIITLTSTSTMINSQSFNTFH